MVVLAESFLQMIETNAISIARNRILPVDPITHRRYVDDSHDRFMTKNNSEEFLKILNDQDDRCQFTAEYETITQDNSQSTAEHERIAQDNSQFTAEQETITQDKSHLNYLEVTTINNKKGHYEFKVYRKDAITNIQIKPDSCHDIRIKEGVFKGYITRAKAICSKEHLEEEIMFIKQIFIENGYAEDKLNKLIKEVEKKTKRNEAERKRYISLPWIPGLSQKLKKAYKRANCTITFKSPRNLESILTSKNKPEMPKNNQPGVYFIATDCHKAYTGETKKQVSTRNREHEKAIFKGDRNDAVAEHQNICGCKVDTENTKTIAVEPMWYKRKVREALEIRRLKTGPNEDRGLNRDLGDYVTTDSWSSLFTRINKIKGMPTFESMTANNSNNVTGVQESSDAVEEPIVNRSQSSMITRSRSRNMTSLTTNRVTSTNTNNTNQVTSTNYANRTM